jgi:D-alanyl-D-alanine endopeptidase (penicillin-binding protein 7)
VHKLLTPTVILNIEKGEHMSNFVPGSCFIQQAMHLCFGFVFVGLVVAAHTAQSEEGSFAPTPDILMTQLVRSDADWLLPHPYRLNTNVAVTRSEDSAPAGSGFSNTPRLFLVSEPRNEAVWSTNACGKITSDIGHALLSPLLRDESKEEPLEINPQTLAALIAHAETQHHILKLDNALSTPMLHKASSLKVQSHIALIFDEHTQLPLYNKNSQAVVPIASITKLMTAMVMLDANLPMDEAVSVAEDDPNTVKRARSRLSIGMTFTRSEMLKLALMASENRAALALARSYPGGTAAMVAAMNAKASVLGMKNTRFFDPTGLDSENVSTAQDLVKMVSAAHQYALIHQYTTSTSHSVEGLRGRTMRFNNTNPLVRNASWDIGLSKTGFINEAGRCLVMQATINLRPVIIVLLDSWGKRTRVGDANRIKRWMDSANTHSRASRRG